MWRLYHYLLTGAIDVGYRTESGNISALTEGQFLATPGQDFVSRDSVVRLEDGQQSVFINISTSDVSYKDYNVN